MITTGQDKDEDRCVQDLRAGFRAYLDAVVQNDGDVVLKKMTDQSCFVMTLVWGLALSMTRPLCISNDQRKGRLLDLVRAIDLGFGQTQIVENADIDFRDR